MDIDQKVPSAAAGFEQASFNTLLVTLVLGLLAFAPGSFLLLAGVKTLVIALGTLISLIFFILSRMKVKSFGVSLHPLVLTGAATAVVIILSSLFSPNLASSFFGKNFSADTAAFLLTLFVAGALAFALTRSNVNRTFWVFSAILGSFSLLALFHIVRFFAGANFLSLGTFTSMVYTTVGSWHDLGIFAGLALILSLVTIQLLPMKDMAIKGLFIAAFVLASIILIVVDLKSVWIIVAITTLAFAVYKYLADRQGSDKKWSSNMPIFAIVVTVVALLLAWSPGVIGNFIGTNIITRANAAYTEVDLPTGLTMNIAESTLKVSPVFGAGPARFVNQYLKYKPEVVNATPFWSSDFSNGSSFIMTGLVTEGVLGFVLWVLLIVAFFWFGGRTLLRGKTGDTPMSPFMIYGLAASYFGAGLIWLSLLNYMPQHAVLLVLLVLSGVVAAHVASSRGKVINFSEGPFKIPIIVIMWILIAGAAVMAVFYVKNTIAETYFQSAVNTLNGNGSLSVSAQKIQTALKLDKSDVYYQAISQMDIFAVNQVISNSTTTPSQSTVQLIGGLVSDGINSSRLAEQFDPTNPYNYLSEAQVASVAAGIGEQGAYADATSSFQMALTLDPLDPSIYLAAGKLEFFEKNIPAAENDINLALKIKPDYTDALFEAGVISYTEKDYATAVKAFTAVQQYDSTYSNIQQAIDLAKTAQGSAPAAGSSSGSAGSISVPAASSTTSTATSTKTSSKAK